MFKVRWVNETGGEWFGDTYTELADAWVTAQSYFDDEECANDFVRAWEVDEDGNIVSDTAAEEWSISDFQ